MVVNGIITSSLRVCNDTRSKSNDLDLEAVPGPGELNIIPTEGRRPREVYHTNFCFPSDAYPRYVNIGQLRGRRRVCCRLSCLSRCPSKNVTM